MSGDFITIFLPVEGRARLAILAAGAGIAPDQMAVRLIQSRLKKEEEETRKPPAVPLEIGHLLTGAEALQLDNLALKHGVPPEALAAATVRRLLKRDRQKSACFRLKMPEAAKRKLEEHARALGCGAGELAAFLFSKRRARPDGQVLASP